MRNITSTVPPKRGTGCFSIWITHKWLVRTQAKKVAGAMGPPVSYWVRHEPLSPGTAGIRPAMKGIVNLNICTQPLWRVAVPGLRCGVSPSPWERRYPTGHEKDRQPENLYPATLESGVPRASLRRKPFPPGTAGIRPAMKKIVNLRIYTQPLWRASLRRKPSILRLLVM